MANIGGNITGKILVKHCEGKNAIGEPDIVWNEAFVHMGWLGLMSGDSNRSNFNAKVEESTHVFLCDYNDGIYALADADTRMIIKNHMYDVTLIDNPDEMNEQLEIYLRKIGGQNG